MTKASLVLPSLVFVIVSAAPMPGGAMRPRDGKPPADRRNFVACPIVRDTKSVPCWLAEYEGELYYLGQQGNLDSEFYPPQLSHQALVEGTVADGPRVCGGVPLTPVAVSALPEIDRACNTLLPAEDKYEAPKPPPPPSRAPTSDETRVFTVTFDFDSDFLTRRAAGGLSEAARIAKDHKAARVEVAGFRATTLLSNGRSLVEKAPIAESRARKVAEVLTGLGLPPADVLITSKNEPEPGDGVHDPQNRRVTITLRP
jgi:outer membrane protein OmpA-like peptidoglycan-associated protein